MTVLFALWLALLVALANLPFCNSRALWGLWRVARKTAWHYLGEWLINASLALLFSLGWERQSIGNVYTKSWEFFVIVAVIFSVLSLPGIYYRLTR